MLERNWGTLECFAEDDDDDEGDDADDDEGQDEFDHTDTYH